MISRRGLFSSLIDRVKEATSGIVESPTPKAKAKCFPVHRPPGAVAEEDFLARCTRCGDCLKACPHDAIVLAPSRMREAAGTPVIVANDKPCLHCDGTPCSSVCEPGVLRVDFPQKMGTASINQMECLAWQRTFCTVCEERCPIPGAISLDLGRPIVNSQACTGCGVCFFVCPAPRKAVLLLPEAHRPAWEERETDDPEP